MHKPTSQTSQTRIQAQGMLTKNHSKKGHANHLWWGQLLWPELTKDYCWQFNGLIQVIKPTSLWRCHGNYKITGLLFLEKLRKESRVVVIPMFPMFFSVRATIPIANSKTSSLPPVTRNDNMGIPVKCPTNSGTNHSRHRHHQKGIFSEEFTSFVDQFQICPKCC